MGENLTLSIILYDYCLALFFFSLKFNLPALPHSCVRCNFLNVPHNIFKIHPLRPLNLLYALYVRKRVWLRDKGRFKVSLDMNAS